MRAWSRVWPHAERSRYEVLAQVMNASLSKLRMAVAQQPRVASWMLSRVNRETRLYHQVADNDRLALLGAAADRARYAAFLTRIYGFEAPLESALTTTPDLDQWIDLRDRAHIKLLRADLQSLGIVDLRPLPRCSAIPSFRHPADALGWIYVAERNTMLHGVIDRHLRGRLPEVLQSAGSYLAGQQRSTGLRISELGAAMDRIAKDPACAERIVSSAKHAFRVQHGWYEVAVSSRLRVA